MNFIGKKIRTLRLMLDIQQQVFAESIGMRHSALSQIERAKNNPTYETLFNIIHTYGVPPLYFFEEKYQLKLENGAFSIENETVSGNKRLVEEIIKLKERLEINEERLLLKEERITHLIDKLESHSRTTGRNHTPKKKSH